MEAEIKSEGSNKTLNNLVATTVVVLSVFMAVGNIKDGNIVQNIQLSKADEVDAWGEYQGTKLKSYVLESSLTQLRLQTGNSNAEAVAKAIQDTEAALAKQNAQAKDQLAKAQGFKPTLEALNFTDDQFDISEAFTAIAIATAAVAALVESFPLLCLAWASGAMGIIMGLAGFLGWQIHPNWLAAILT